MILIKAFLLVLIINSATSFLEEDPLVVGSFNINDLNSNKLNSPQFLNTVTKVLARYDILLIQEIEDTSENNADFQILIDALNEHVENDGVKYEFVISPRLGRSNYKEQQAFLYKNSLYTLYEGLERTITLNNAYVFNDTKDSFDRSPYIAEFSLNHTDLPVKDFTIINLTIKPTDALEENLALRDVIESIPNHNLMIMGDMNFDCNSMSNAKKEKVREELSEFEFFINDDVSTTTNLDECALDRILMSSDVFKNSVLPGSNQSYIYYKNLGISNEEADVISDHYPVEIQFKKPETNNYPEKSLRVGSFNIESLGPTKISYEDVVETIVKILSRFDIVLIQEIKDSSENNADVFQKLMDALNAHVANSGIRYEFAISPRLGQTSYKEQKAYVYKNSVYRDGSRKINLKNTYVYNDIEQIYSRSPYVAEFSIENSELPVKDFFIINLHLKPFNVLNESLALKDVVAEINNPNVLIMGDMNFDCRYMSGVKKEQVREELSNFTFYINDDVSTTTSDELCALDRILLRGDTFKDSVVRNSNGTYLYYEKFNMTIDEADKVSDHFPVEIDFNQIVEEDETNDEDEHDIGANRTALLIGSFNIQSLGPTKMGRPDFVEIVIKILARYDIILIQEIKDSSENNAVFQVLIDALNTYVASNMISYEYVISPRLGSTSYKEQKAYLYRIDSRGINVTNHYIFNDTEGVYARSPYVADFVIENTDLPVKNFSMINLHLRPDEVFEEAMGLRDVIDNISNPNIMIMGDMNFDCNYASNAKRELVRQELSEFTFYINDDVSTTTSTALCALDRIIISGESFKDSVVSGSNGTYLYYLKYNMTNDEADRISDHYPVEIKLDN